MDKSRTLRNIVSSDLGLLVGLALARIILHTLTTGAVAAERWLASLSGMWPRLVKGITGGALAVGGALFAVLALPLAPLNSPLWNVVSNINDGFREEIGWPELAETAANIRAALPVEERSQVGILAYNYGEAGAINLYGPVYGLPRAISGVNSYWLRGYGDPPPQTLIVIGFTRDYLEQTFEACELAGHITNRYNVKNEESKVPDIFVCRRPRETWPEFWQRLKRFG
jgi:hypothetical protein